MTTTTHTTPRGETITYLRNGSKVASITEQANGTYYVALFIDYGQDGRSFCDSGLYKTMVGAMRKAQGFVK